MTRVLITNLISEEKLALHHSVTHPPRHDFCPKNMMMLMLWPLALSPGITPYTRRSIPSSLGRRLVKNILEKNKRFFLCSWIVPFLWVDKMCKRIGRGITGQRGKFEQSDCGIILCIWHWSQRGLNYWDDMWHRAGCMTSVHENWYLRIEKLLSTTCVVSIAHHPT